MRKRIANTLVVCLLMTGLSLSAVNQPVTLPAKEDKPVIVQNKDSSDAKSHQLSTVLTGNNTDNASKSNDKAINDGQTDTNSASNTDNVADVAQKRKSKKTEYIEETTETDYHSSSSKTNITTEDATEPELTSQIYKYCPAVINGTILYCSNEANPGKVKDQISLNGSQVLSTTAGSWDSAQVCDPTVVSGNFTYNGTSYQYLMAYLGCATYDNTNNEIGFAVSNDLYNWVKTGKIVSCAGDGFWGVGQPSLLNINNDGCIYLFYTSGTAAKTTTYVQYLNCNDMNNIQNLGTSEITTAYDFISNADVAYSDGYLYMTCDTHPFSDGALNFISDKQTIYKSPWDCTLDGLSSLNWSVESTIGADSTGFTKNHNAGFNRDGFGNLVSRTVYVTTASEVGEYLDNLFTYRFVPVNF